MAKVQVFTEDALIVVVLIDETECSSLILRSERIGYTDSMIISDGKQIVAKEIRNNKRVLLDDFELADKFWSKVSNYVPEVLDGCSVVGLNERFRFYRYEPKQIFRLHKDFPHKIEGQQSKLSMIIYLNRDFEGGETDFRTFVVYPKTGSALIFKHELLHEGCAVINGKKYAVRTDIMYRTAEI